MNAAVSDSCQTHVRSGDTPSVTHVRAREGSATREARRCSSRVFGHTTGGEIRSDCQVASPTSLRPSESQGKDERENDLAEDGFPYGDQANRPSRPAHSFLEIGDGVHASGTDTS